MFGSYEAHNKKKGPFIKEQYEAPHQMLQKAF